MTEPTARDASEALDTIEKQASADERASTPPRRGRTLAALALLIALLAATGTGYALWQWWQAAQENATNDWQGALATALDETAQAREAADAVRAELQRALGEREREVAQLIEESARQRQALAEAVASQSADSQIPPGAWRLAEAEYLLRIANHRLLMERDASGAKHLLQLADDILRDTQNFAFHEVRALLAEDMAALATFTDADVQGVFLRLEAMKKRLRQLPLRLPEYIATPVDETEQADTTAPPQATPAEPASMLASLAQRLTDLVRFRRHQGDARRPLLPPQQADYLHMNLRLALDRAQLAALRHDAEIFRISLTEARAWLLEFVDARRPVAVDMAQELDELLQTNLAAELPDMSRSLTLLRQLRTRNAVAGPPE